MKEFDQLVHIIRQLRGKNGCPWDKAQKLKNYKKYLLEEAYELIDELEKNDTAAMKEEIGDLFLILVMIAQMLGEKRKTTLQEIFLTINNKLVSRHPHVFKRKKFATKEEVLSYWIKHKAKKKKRRTILERLPKTLPALLLADVYHKECRHIKKSNAAYVKKEALCAHTAIKRLLQRPQITKENLTEILFKLSHLAHARHIDLEGCLRKRILTLAGQAAYE